VEAECRAGRSDDSFAIIRIAEEGTALDDVLGIFCYVASRVECVGGTDWIDAADASE
jgi:hypothetical protein